MTTPTTPVRVAVIGTSAISGSFSDAVAAADGIRVDAVFSRDPVRAAEAAERFGAAWSSASLDEVLGSPLIDAVYIASPNSVHAGQAAAAIAAGKHVLVEKPAVLASAQWRDLVEQSRAAGVVLLEAMRTAYDPGTALVRSLLPQLGDIRSVSFRYAKRSSRYDQVLAGERVNMFDPALGGGALADLGVYCLHAMVGFFGMPDRVAAAVVPLSSGVEGAGSIVASYPAMVAELGYSKISTTQLGSEIQGEDATLVVDLIASPRVVELIARDGTVSRHEIAGDPHPLAGEVDRFVELIVTGADPSPDHLLTEQTLRLLEQVRAAVAD